MERNKTSLGGTVVNTPILPMQDWSSISDQGTRSHAAAKSLHAANKYSAIKIPCATTKTCNKNIFYKGRSGASLVAQ